MKSRFIIYLASALVVSPVFACATYSVTQISQAIQNSPNATAADKASSCTWGGAAKAESGGKTCATNKKNFGVLQLAKRNLPHNLTSTQYLNMPLQQQVNIWLEYAGPSTQGSSFNTINNTAKNGGSIGGMKMTQGIAAACSQFGGLICSKDLASIRSTGQCPTIGHGGVRATKATLANGTANLDGNYKSICSWGATINHNIIASGCKSGACKASPTTPQNSTGTTAPGAIPAPTTNFGVSTKPIIS